jgi:hypothetical protein
MLGDLVDVDRVAVDLREPVELGLAVGVVDD